MATNDLLTIALLSLPVVGAFVPAFLADALAARRWPKAVHVQRGSAILAALISTSLIASAVGFGILVLFMLTGSQAGPLADAGVHVPTAAGEILLRGLVAPLPVPCGQASPSACSALAQAFPVRGISLMDPRWLVVAFSLVCGLGAAALGSWLRARRR